jgi:hypothetical protein
MYKRFETSGVADVKHITIVWHESIQCNEDSLLAVPEMVCGDLTAKDVCPVQFTQATDQTWVNGANVVNCMTDDEWLR